MAKNCEGCSHMFWEGDTNFYGCKKDCEEYYDDEVECKHYLDLDMEEY